MKRERILYSNRWKQSLLWDQVEELHQYLRLSAEFGCSKEGEALYEKAEKELQQLLDCFQQLVCSVQDSEEPNDLESIRKLRPQGPRCLQASLPEDYAQRLRGAFYGRLAGCTLGAALEFEPIEAAKAWALSSGDSYPLTDYWSRVRHPEEVHYLVGKKKDLTRNGMNAVPPDDDIMYTLLGMLTMETYGKDFSPEQEAKIWMKYLPLGSDKGSGGEKGCWWGERILLQNLLHGDPLPQAGIQRNPYLQSIAAWTRVDSYGYVFAGNPEQAAALAYRDASMNHRRNGVYGAMFMAAAIAAAFVVDDPMEALAIGLTEIPEHCLFAEGVRWALQQSPKNYQEAFDLVWERYDGMFNGSALTNALHVVMGLKIGQRDFTKTIGETVAMSGDNDCTGATAGSILGAVIGKNKIPDHWIRPFQGKIHSYLYELPEYLEIEEVCRRLEKLAYQFHS